MYRRGARCSRTEKSYILPTHPNRMPPIWQPFASGSHPQRLPSVAAKDCMVLVLPKSAIPIPGWLKRDGDYRQLAIHNSEHTSFTAAASIVISCEAEAAPRSMTGKGTEAMLPPPLQ